MLSSYSGRERVLGELCCLGDESAGRGVFLIHDIPANDPLTGNRKNEPVFVAYTEGPALLREMLQLPVAWRSGWRLQQLLLRWMQRRRHLFAARDRA